MCKRLISAAALILLLTSAVAVARDCGDGTKRATFNQMHSFANAGRLAIAPRARNSDEARRGGLFCVLMEDAAHVGPSTANRLYFVYNNLTTGDSRLREHAFIGIETRERTSTGIISLNLRKEGDWEATQIDRQFPERQVRITDEEARRVAENYRPIRFAALQTGIRDTPSTPDEDRLARTYGASVHGAIRPLPDAPLKRTWDLRDRARFVGDLFRAPESGGQSVVLVWISFDQRSEEPWYSRDWPTRVVTEISIDTPARSGTLRKLDVHLFGSAANIRELRHSLTIE